MYYSTLAISQTIVIATPQQAVFYSSVDDPWDDFPEAHSAVQQLLLAFDIVSLKHVHVCELVSLRSKEHTPYFQATLFERAVLTSKMIYQFMPNN